MFNSSDIKGYYNFCEFNERGLIEQNDLSKYSSFDDIMTQLGVAELKADMKELESQVKKIYDGDEWLVVRPLTYHASTKYGANTKWCTTAANEYSYFRKYATNGILLYMINKVTGVKVACYKSLQISDPEFSFWNQIDKRIDSLESGLPYEILQIIQNETLNNPISNRSYLTTEQIEKDDTLNGYGAKKKYLVDVASPFGPAVATDELVTNDAGAEWDGENGDEDHEMTDTVSEERELFPWQTSEHAPMEMRLPNERREIFENETTQEQPQSFIGFNTRA
jgi:hypothetical protein